MLRGPVPVVPDGEMQCDVMVRSDRFNVLSNVKVLVAVWQQQRRLAGAQLVLLPSHDANCFPTVTVSSQTSGLMCLRSGSIADANPAGLNQCGPRILTALAGTWQPVRRSACARQSHVCVGAHVRLCACACACARVCVHVGSGGIRWHAHPRQGLMRRHCEGRSQHHDAYPLRIGFRAFFLPPLVDSKDQALSSLPRSACHATTGHRTT